MLRRGGRSDERCGVHGQLATVRPLVASIAPSASPALTIATATNPTTRCIRVATTATATAAAFLSLGDALCAGRHAAEQTDGLLQRRDLGGARHRLLLLLLLWSEELLLLLLLLRIRPSTCMLLLL
jgi:hypothetical protein